MTDKCTWETCPILKVIEDVGIDDFIEGVKEEKRKSCGLLTEVASVAMFVHYYKRG